MILDGLPFGLPLLCCCSGGASSLCCCNGGTSSPCCCNGGASSPCCCNGGTSSLCCCNGGTSSLCCCSGGASSPCCCNGGASCLCCCNGGISWICSGSQDECTPDSAVLSCATVSCAPGDISCSEDSRHHGGAVTFMNLRYSRRASESSKRRLTSGP